MEYGFKFKKNLFFLWAYVTYIVYNFYIRSGYSMISSLSFLSKGLRLMCLFFLALHVWINNKIAINGKSIVAGGLFILLTLYNYISGGYTDLIFVCAFTIVGTTIDFDVILRASRNTIMLCLLVIFLSCGAGILNDNIFQHNTLGLEAHTLGFNYYSFPQSMISACIIITLYMKGKKCKIGDYIAAIIVNYISYRIFTTRLYFYNIILVVILNFIANNIGIIKFKNKIWKYIVSTIYFAMCSLTLLATKYYDSLNIHWYNLNKVLSGRLRMLERAYATYDINLLGQKVVNIGAVEKSLDSSLAGSIYIDCGYMYSLFAYGIIFTILILFVHTILFRKAYEQGNIALCIWLLVLSAMNLINDFFVSLVSNPLLILAFKVTIESPRQGHLGVKVVEDYNNNKSYCKCSREGKRFLQRKTSGGEWYAEINRKF